MLSKRLLQRYGELEEANNELEAFAYSVSHDLRAPLRAIDGYSRILEENNSGVLDEGGLRVIGVVREEAARMRALIDDLLSFSMLGHKAITISRVDMKTLALSAIDELTTEDQRKRVPFHVSDLPDAGGDPSLLRLVWTNLISNAIMYSSIWETPVITVTAKINGAEVTYSVRDNGAGFDMEYADAIFGVFKRLHREEKFEGTGIGLANVRRIIQRHNGRVWAESKEGEGAVFRFSLPKTNFAEKGDV